MGLRWRSQEGLPRCCSEEWADGTAKPQGILGALRERMVLRPGPWVPRGTVRAGPGQAGGWGPAWCPSRWKEVF